MRWGQSSGIAASIEVSPNGPPKERAGSFLSQSFRMVALAVVATAAVMAAWSVVDAFSTKASPLSDFGALWRAGTWALGPQRDSLYPMSSFGTAGRASAEPFLGYLNPPHAAVLFAPFGSLPFDPATNVFLALNLACLVALLVAAARFLRSVGWPKFDVALAGLLVIASPALAATLVNGTISLWLALVVGGLIWSDRRGDHVGTGVLAAALTVKPQYVLLPVLFLLGQRHWRALSAMVGTTFVVIVTTLPVTGFAPWRAYGPFLSRYAGFADLWGPGDQGYWLPLQMPNLRGVLLRVFGLDSVAAVNAMTAVALGCAAVLVVFLGHRVRRGSNLPCWISVVCLAVATGQHTNVADSLVLVPALLALSAVPGVRRIHVFGAFGLLWFSLAFGNTPGSVPTQPWSGLFVLALTAATLTWLPSVWPGSRSAPEDTPA